MMKLEELRQDSMNSFRALFDEDFARENLEKVRWFMPLFLFAFTLGSGILPLVLRLEYDSDRLHKLLMKIREGSVYRSIHTVLICGCGGQLLVMVFANVLPMLRSLIHSSNMFPNAEIYLCLGFLLTHLIQEVAFLFFGNTELNYIEQCHIYLVHFIRYETRVSWLPPMPPRQTSVEKLKLEAENSGDDLISIDDLDRLQEQLRIDSKEAVELQTYARAEHDSPALRATKYWIERRNYLRRKNPKLSLKVCIGVIILCLHAILDGFCMGLQPNENLTMYALWSLGFHRMVIALLTGFELLTSNFKTRSIMWVIVVYSLMAPIGSLLASLAAFEEVGFEKLALMMGISGGSLLYVTFFELFRSNKAMYVREPGQSVCALLGYILALYFYTWSKTRSII